METIAALDIVFGPARVAVFVDGCFWHGCPDHGVRSHDVNSWYWRAKIQGNRETRIQRAVSKRRGGRCFGSGNMMTPS